MEDADWETLREVAAPLKNKVMTADLPQEEPLHTFPILMLPTPFPAGMGRFGEGFQAGLIPAPEGIRPLEDPSTFMAALKRLTEL